MIWTLLRAWVVAGAGLLLATAGLRSLLVTGAITSLTRTAVAAGILGVYAAVLAVLTTRRPGRTRLSCLLVGGTVPLLVGVVTAVAVASQAADLPRALLAGAPWLAGVLLAFLAGPWLPALRLPRLRRSGP